MSWALQDAKAKFSEVVKRAQTEGPQEVTVRGERAAVVVSVAEFEALRERASSAKEKTFIDHLLEDEPWPDWFVEIVNDRSKDPGRDIEF